MGGLCFQRATLKTEEQKNVKGAKVDFDTCPCKIMFPGRIFSHLLLSLEECAVHTLKLGYMFRSTERQQNYFRIDLMTGEVEKFINKNDKLKLNFEAKSLN